MAALVPSLQYSSIGRLEGGRTLLLSPDIANGATFRKAEARWTPSPMFTSQDPSHAWRRLGVPAAGGCIQKRLE